MKKIAILLLFLCLTVPTWAAKSSKITAQGAVASDTPDSVNIVKARQKGRQQLFKWEEWNAETFAKAKKEKKFILLDCAAEWCHWCHVMDATTYVDPEIGATLRDKFVAIRIDVDNRPDLAERYGDWGWPATILFSSDREELGKYRGYLPPEEFRSILTELPKVAASAQAKKNAAVSMPVTNQRPSVEALPWIGAKVTADLDRYYDIKEGSWGRFQKAPLGGNAQFELRRAAHGDKEALERATFTLKKQSVLIDPVWGGICQYSAGSTWEEPHFEKLMTYQASNLEAYAKGYALTKDKALLKNAKLLDSFIQNFFTSPEGTFYTTQDADLNAHDHDKPFVDGHVYYALNDKERRKLGIPRIETRVYAHENGLTIAALCSLYETTKDRDVLARAKKAADKIWETHVAEDGSVRHEAQSNTKLFFLADAAAYGWGLARLAEVTGDSSYRDKALKVGQAFVKNFVDSQSGGAWEHTPDPNASGVFAQPLQPFVHNVTGARFLAALGRVTKDTEWRQRSQRILAAISTVEGIFSQGRQLGDYLLAMDEAEVVPWK